MSNLILLPIRGSFLTSCNYFEAGTRKTGAPKCAFKGFETLLVLAKKLNLNIRLKVISMLYPLSLLVFSPYDGLETDGIEIEEC